MYLNFCLGHFIYLLQKPIDRQFTARIFLGVIKTLMAQLLNQTNKMHVADA